MAVGMAGKNAPTSCRRLPMLYGSGRVCGRELRAGRTGWIIWTAALSAVTIGFMSFAPNIASMPQLNDLMTSLPKGIAAAFNYDRLSLDDPLGYFATEPFTLLVLFAAFYAAVGAASILAKEESDKTAEFLLTRPVRRSAVVIGKAAAVCVSIVAMHVVLACAVVLGFAWFAPEFNNVALLLRLVLGSALVALAFAGVALALSTTLAEARAALNAGIGLVWGLYVVKILAAVVASLDWLGYLSPFAYADGADIVYSGGPLAWQIAVLLAVWVVGVATAIGAYRRKQIRA